jgi:phage repressor protein C with HTH and peptisase S24 domain
MIEAGKILNKIKNQADMARLMNVLEQNLTNWKRRGVPKDVIVQLQNDWGLNINWVRTGDGDMFLKSNVVQITSINRPLSQKGNITIPQYDAVGSMGGGILLNEQSGVISHWEVSAEWIQKNLKGYTDIKNVAIVTGFGDSMQGIFNSGDPIFIDTGVTSFNGDSPYFFRIDNDGYIKRLQKIPGVGLVAISNNNAYERFTITADMDFTVFGRVIKTFNSMDF